MTALVVAAAVGGGGGGGGGSPPAGVTVSPGFNVTGSSFAHGSTLTVDLTSGLTLPAMQFGSNGTPWLFDTVDAQYLDGVNQNAYSGFADGTNIGLALYGWQSITGGGPSDVMTYSTSRSMRTSYNTATYSTLNMQKGKGGLGLPPWPGGWGPQDNLSFLLSFWARSSAPFQGSGGGDATCKVCRFSESSDIAARPGINAWSSGSPGYSSHANPSGQSDFTNIRSGNANAWMRHDFWMEYQTGASIWSTLGQLLNCWSGVMGSGIQFQMRHYSGFGGAYESSHPTDVMYAPNLPTGSYWDPAANGQPFSNVTTTLFGFDDGHGLSVGTDYDIAEVYCHTDLWRPMLADKLVWDSSPTTTMNSENCGIFQRVSATRFTVTLNFGQFAPGTTGLGLFLPYLNDRKSGILVCHN